MNFLEWLEEVRQEHETINHIKWLEEEYAKWAASPDRNHDGDDDEDPDE